MCEGENSIRMVLCIDIRTSTGGPTSNAPIAQWSRDTLCRIRTQIVARIHLEGPSHSHKVCPSDIEARIELQMHSTFSPFNTMR